MTTRQEAIQQGKEAGEAIAKHEQGAIENLHKQLVDLQKEDTAQPKNFLKQNELKALTQQLVDKKVLPDVDLAPGDDHNKYRIVGTTVDTTDPSKKELVVAIGQKADGHAQAVVIMDKDGKYHEAEPVKNAKGEIIGYKRKEGGQTYNDASELASKFGDAPSSGTPADRPPAPGSGSGDKATVTAEVKDGLRVYHIKYPNGQEATVNFDPASGRVTSFVLPDGTRFEYDPTCGDYRSKTNQATYRKPIVGVKLDADGNLVLTERNGEDIVFQSNGQVSRRPAQRNYQASAA